MIDRDDPADPPDILLVEPSADAATRVERAIETGSYEAALHVVPDGSACLDLLRRRGESADAPRPRLVVFGTGVSEARPELESESGAVPNAESTTESESESESSIDSLLEAIADDPDLRRLPIVVCLPSTATRDDVRRCYDRRANAVVVLPDDDAAVVDDLRHTFRFWIAAARLPDPDRTQ